MISFESTFQPNVYIHCVMCQAGQFRVNFWAGWLFYGISTFFGSFNTELNNFDKSFKQFNLVLVQFFVYPQLNVKTINFKQFSLVSLHSSIWPILFWLWARVDLGAMEMKEYSTFPKAPALLKPHHQIVWCHIQETH